METESVKRSRLKSNINLTPSLISFWKSRVPLTTSVLFTLPKIWHTNIYIGIRHLQEYMFPWHSTLHFETRWQSISFSPQVTFLPLSVSSQWYTHIETSPLVCRLTGFFINVTLTWYGLKVVSATFLLVCF